MASTQMGKRNKSDLSQLRARAAAHGVGVRPSDFKRRERALALRYISLGVSVSTAAQAHEVLPQTIRNWQERAATGDGLQVAGSDRQKSRCLT